MPEGDGKDLHGFIEGNCGMVELGGLHDPRAGALLVLGGRAGGERDRDGGGGGKDGVGGGGGGGGGGDCFSALWEKKELNRVSCARNEGNCR